MSSSLRDQYSSPSSAWSFTPDDSPLSLANSSSSAGSGPGPSTSSSFQWKSRGQQSIFNLSPDVSINDVSEIDVVEALRTVFASAFLQYSSTAIAMPWEVGKMLLQVQWVPKDPETVQIIEQTVEEDETSADSDNEDEDSSYFADPGVPASTKNGERERYRSEHSSLDSQPEYIIPLGPQDGVWGMMKRVARFRGEGWLALWKGLLTSCTIEILSSTLQPIIHTTLQALFFPSPTTIYAQPPLLLPVVSHLLTGFLFSPLDLIRTRLIVQSSSFFHPHYTRYSGPFDALGQIIRDEGGVAGIYLHPHLLVPTLIDCTLRPLVALTLPGLIVSYFGSGEPHPIVWGMAELAGSCIGLLVTLPFETVRRRLQVQMRGNAVERPIKGCVQLRPKPYHGVVDVLWKIVSEEKSDGSGNDKGERRKAQESRNDEREAKAGKNTGGWFVSRNTGIAQLYRGLGMRLGASVIVFVLALVSGGGAEEDAGWAEL
jgi:mitochondrial fusion and transport protein UGO1